MAGDNLGCPGEESEQRNSNYVMWNHGGKGYKGGQAAANPRMRRQTGRDWKTAGTENRSTAGGRGLGFQRTFWVMDFSLDCRGGYTIVNVCQNS